MDTEYVNDRTGFDRKIIKMSKTVEKEIEDIFKSINSIKEYNQIKVIRAMQKNKLSESHFTGTTGYGYGDRGREVLESVYAGIFNAEDALVRHHITTGTQALTLCLFGILRPGDELLSVTGRPYDTLEEVIGLRGEDGNSLRDFGIKYRQINLNPENKCDCDKIEDGLNEKTRMVLIQRSRGYEWKKSLRIDEIGRIIKSIRRINNNAVILVDNCYGEFVEDREPTEAGADLVAGSLIKNPGGGIAPTGGYIAGKEELVKQAACRLTSPGLGKEVGSTLGLNRLLFQGIFFAPHVVAESLKGAVFCAALMKKLGFEISPLPDDNRSDIIQAVKFNNAESLIMFCRGIQKGSPVDAHVLLQPWDMPGYDCKVIMAAGGFIQGSSIELSADAPVRPPYIAYVQGGLVYESVKLGVLTAVQNMARNGLLKIDIS